MTFRLNFDDSAAIPMRCRSNCRSMMNCRRRRFGSPIARRPSRAMPSHFYAGADANLRSPSAYPRHLRIRFNSFNLKAMAGRQSAEGVKDPAHINEDWIIDRGTIDGVAVREVRSVVTANSVTTEICRSDWASSMV
jgi:hypothetical protein